MSADLKDKIHIETVKLLVLTSKKASLYSKDHPIVKQSLSQLFEHFKEILDKEYQVIVSLRGEALFFNEISLSLKTLRTQELAKRLKELEIDSISFKKGLELDELEKLTNLLRPGKKLDEKEEKVKETFLKEGFKHIKANLIHYEKIAEGQRIVSRAVEEAESFLEKTKEGPKILTEEKAKEETKEEVKEEILESFSDFLAGKFQRPPTEKDKKDIINKLINQPASLTKVIVEAAVACRDLHQVLLRFQECIIDELASRFIKGKSKPERVVLGLKRSVLKSLSDPEVTNQIKDSAKDLDGIFSKFSDKLEVRILAKIFEQTKEDFNKFSKRASKLLTAQEELQRLIPELRQALEAQGLSPQRTDELLAGLESNLKTKEKITISKSEYEELKNKSELFDKTLIERIGEATEELKKKNKRLRDEKERVDTVLRNLSDGLIVVDKEGKVVMMNPTAGELLGIKKEERIGKPLTEGLTQHQLVALTKGNLADEGGSVSKVIELKGTDEKTKLILRTSTAVVENESGNTVGMVMMLSDITRQKQLEKMKSEFVAHTSHELRTPLIATQKSLSLLLSKTAGEMSENQHKFLEIANSNLSRLSHLIDDILDFSKIEAGKLKLKPDVFNLSELIKEVNQSVASWAKDKQIELISEIPQTKIEVEADRERISQVLTNLVSNALKFTQEKGKVIVSCKDSYSGTQTAGKECVLVNVTDNGIGIEKKDCERIFEEFEQVSLASPEGVSSTGLGLAISKEIIQMHSGNIWVESQIGKGSTFSFVIPKKFIPLENKSLEQ